MAATTLAPRASRSLGAALRSRTVQSGLVCLFYAASSILLSVVNKAVLSSYQFSCYFLLLAVQLVVALAFCSCSRWLGNPFSIPSIRSWKHLLAAMPMATCFVMNVGVGFVGWGTRGRASRERRQLPSSISAGGQAVHGCDRRRASSSRRASGAPIQRRFTIPPPPTPIHPAPPGRFLALKLVNMPMFFCIRRLTVRRAWVHCIVGGKGEMGLPAPPLPSTNHAR